MKLKKVLITLGALFLILISAIISAPFLFKDQIKAIIDEQIAANINAEVIFDIDNFSLSLLPNFPNLTAGISELGVIGRDEFAGEVLFAIDEFKVEVNLKKLIFDDQMSIQSISLISPQIFIKVLADGKANYDIAIPSEEIEQEPATEETNFSLAIESWEIANGEIIYDDATTATYIKLSELNHSGSGNFSLTVFDLGMETDVILSQISYGGDNYLDNKRLKMEMVLGMDLDQMRFEFKENTIALNEFSFGFDGWLAMPGDDIDMDITFNSKDNSFKSIISLIPAIYSNDFNDLESSGTFQFDGAVKGIYNEISLPAFNLNMAINDGMFHYPDLPEAVSNVEVKLNIANEDGNIDHTKINLSKFHVDFGPAPFDGFLSIANLTTYPIDMGIKTKLDLGKMSALFPTEGLLMEGVFEIDFMANGIYDSVNSIIPKIEAKMALENGQIIYTDLPTPLKDFHFIAEVNNSTGKIDDTKVSVSSFNLEIDGSPISGSLVLDHFDDIHWQAALEGNLDFAKLFPIINKVYPMPGTKMAGKMAVIFETEGRMSDVESERYERLRTHGSLSFDNFIYTDSVSLPQGFLIKSGEFSMSPNNLKVTALSSELGSSDFLVDGNVSNYLKYVFEESETIVGNITLRSNKIDLNEFMTVDESEAEPSAESESYAVIEVPANIDFVLNANIDQIIYEDMVMTNGRGKIIVKNGIMYLDNLATSTLGGTITFNGNYNTKKPDKPTFNMGLKVANVNIKEAYRTFNSVEKLAPIAKNMDGTASTNFSFRGVLLPDMMPDMNTLNGQGLISIKDARLSDSKLASGLTSQLGRTGNDNLTLNDMTMDVTISNGRLHVKPFDVKINSYNANVGGSTGIDGSLDYAIKMDIPAGEVGSQINALLGSVSGTGNSSDIIKVNLGVKGTYDNPRVTLLGTDSKDLAKAVAVNQISKMVGGDNAALIDSLANVDAKVLFEEQKKLAEAELKRQQDSLKIVAEEAAKKEVEKAKKRAVNEAANQLNKLFGKKKKKNN